MGEKILFLTFLTETGTKFSLSIAYCKDDLTKSQIQTAAAQMIASNAIQAKGGKIAKIVSAKYKYAMSADILA